MSSVDVIVPCYRYGHFLRECVESVLAQSLNDIRVLILDDASPDNTAEVGADLAREDSRVTLMRHDFNKGHIATYNEGIDWASADYMLLLSADDYLLPGALDRAARLMESHPEVGFVFGKAMQVGVNGDFQQMMTVPGIGEETVVLAGRKFIQLSGVRDIVPTPTAVVRTTLLKRLGGYCDALPHTADMEMWLRLAAHASVGVIGACQAVYRRHGNNMSLAYTATSRIPDLRHRNAALEHFLRTCGEMLPNASRLRREMLWSLGCEAIGFADVALDDEQTDACDQLAHFAVSACPDLKRSIPMLKLLCRRKLREKNSHAAGGHFLRMLQAAKNWSSRELQREMPGSDLSFDPSARLEHDRLIQGESPRLDEAHFLRQHGYAAQGHGRRG